MTTPLEFSEHERLVPAGQPAHPRREIWRLMRASELALRAEREAAAKERVQLSQQHAAFIVEVASAYHQLRTFVTENGARFAEADLDGLGQLAAAIESKFASVLRKGGVEVIDAEGAALTVDSTDWVDVVDSVPTAGVERPTFGPVVKPAVRLHGEIIQRAVAPLLVPEANGGSPGTTSDPADHLEEEETPA